MRQAKTRQKISNHQICRGGLLTARPFRGSAKSLKTGGHNRAPLQAHETIFPLFCLLSIRLGTRRLNRAERQQTSQPLIRSDAILRSSNMLRPPRRFRTLSAPKRKAWILNRLMSEVAAEGRQPCYDTFWLQGPLHCFVAKACRRRSNRRKSRKPRPFDDFQKLQRQYALKMFELAK
jgi:hypothetical protein